MQKQSKLNACTLADHETKKCFIKQEGQVETVIDIPNKAGNIILLNKKNYRTGSCDLRVIYPM